MWWETIASTDCLRSR